jgi:hypothetical protein
MKKKNYGAAFILAFSVVSVNAQQYDATPVSLTIPEKVMTSIGTLEFKDGAPSAATTQKLYDNLDFLHAQNVFLNTFQGASTYAAGEGFKSVGAEDNSFLIFSSWRPSEIELVK